METSESANTKERSVSSSSMSATEFVNPAFQDYELKSCENVGESGLPAGESVIKMPKIQNLNGLEDVTQDSIVNSNEFIPVGFRKMYLAALVVLQFAACMGITASYSATAITSMKDPASSIHPSGDEETWIGSLVTVGALCGGTAGGYLSNSLGRKGTLMWNTIPYITGWFFIAYAPSVALIYVGRLITGLNTGIVSVVTPMYLVEISTPETRGLLGAAFQLFVVIGVLFINILGSALTWRYMAVAGACMCLLSMVLMLPMPESPRWLLSKGKRDEAKAALTFLQGESYDAEGECLTIEDEIQKQPQGGLQLRELLVPTVLKPFLLSIALMFFQQCSGVNAVLFYTNSIFEKAKVPLNPTTATIIVASVQVLATLLGSVLMDRAGRKPLLLTSGTCMAVSLYAFSGYAFSVTKDASIIEKMGWFPVVCLTSYIAAFSIGFGPTPWLMVAEMIPVRYRSFVSGVATALNWTFAFCVTKSFDFLTFNIKDYGVYAFYGTICTSSLFVTIFLLPETKGKTMNEIEDYFKSK